MVEAPNSLTYACVVSRESIRIALTLVTCFYQKLRLCSCGTKPQHSGSHQYQWLHDDIIMRTPMSL